jgi:hypothetical protein
LPTVLTRKYPKSLDVVVKRVGELEVEEAFMI